MFGLIKKMFIGLLTSIINGSNPTKCESLSNQKCMIQPTLINQHPNEYIQELHYYPFAVKLHRCVGRRVKTLNDLSNKICARNKIEGLKIHVFNMITGKNESNVLTKDISCECKCIFDRKCISNQKRDKDKCRCGCKKQHVYEKEYNWNPATSCCKNGKFLASIIE